MPLSVTEITGGPGPILNELAKDPSFLEATNVTVGMSIARAIAERRALAFTTAHIKAELQALYDTYVKDNGEYETAERKGDWEEGLDDAVSKLFEPYQRILTNDFLVEATVDTRLYEPGKIDALAVRFAKTVWIVLTYEEGKGTTAKTLSAIGIVYTDIEELMGDRLVAAPDSTQEATQQETKPMAGSLNETLKKLHLVCGSDFDKKEYADAFDLASDTDDGLAEGAIARIGGDMNDVATLRAFRQRNGKNSPAMLCDLLAVAETLPDEDAPETSEEDELAALAGGEADDLAELGGAAPGVDIGDIPPALDRRPGRGANKKPTAAPPPVAGEGSWGFTVPKEALALLKEHTPDKDQDLGEGIGVSRATFNNYTLGKATLHADEAQLAYLKGVINTRMAGLTQALELLQG